MKLFKVAFKEYWSFIKEYRILIIIGIFGLCISNFLYIRQAVNDGFENNIVMSYADSFILSTQGYYIVIMPIPVFLFFLILLCKQCFNENYVIRLNSYQELWNKLFVMSIIHSFFTSISCIVLIFIGGIFNHQGWINFNEKRSFFSLYNEGKTIKNPSFLLVVILCFLLCFCLILMGNSLYLLFYWIINRSLLSFLLVFSIAYIDTFTNLNFLVFTQTSIFYNRWYPRYQFYFSHTLAFVFICFLLGSMYARRKEIRNEK